MQIKFSEFGDLYIALTAPGKTPYCYDDLADQFGDFILHLVNPYDDLADQFGDFCTMT